MSRNAYAETSFLLNIVKGNTNIERFSQHLVLNKNKKNILKVKEYMKIKNHKFSNYFLEKSQWKSFAEVTLKNNFEYPKNLFDRISVGKEDLENFLKNFPLKIIEELVRFFPAKGHKEGINKMPKKKFNMFWEALFESKGEVYRYLYSERKNEEPLGLFVSENFHLYLEQTRIYIDQKNFIGAKTVINNFIKNFFSTSTSLKFGFCLFEHIIRIFSENQFEKENFFKLYLARSIHFSKRQGKIEKMAFEVENFLLFIFLPKRFFPLDNFIFDIYFSSSFVKRTKVFIKILVDIKLNRFLNWSKFKSNLLDLTNKTWKLLGENNRKISLIILRTDILSINLNILSSFFCSSSINFLEKILEMDILDLDSWFRTLVKKKLLKISIDSLGGLVFF